MKKKGNKSKIKERSKAIKKGNKTHIINNNNNNIIKINLPNNNNKNIITANNKRNNKRRALTNINTNNNSKIKSQKTIKKIKTIMNYIDDEINDFPYDLALINDNRTYCQYYFSLIKTHHNLIFSFCYNKDYNSRIIKIDLFFILFALDYTVNGFFYTDDTMHNIYVHKGAFDIEYQLPKIFYSAFITTFVGILLKKLSLSNDAIIEFKKDTKEEEVNKRRMKLNSKLKIKFIFYFLLSFILILFFWYYISMFGAVYNNTQFLLLEDTLLSFGLSLFYPFVIFLIPGIFRIPALAESQKKSEYKYKYSKFFHFL